MKRLLVCQMVLISSLFAGKAEPLIVGERFEIPSSIMQENRTVLVHLPAGYDTLEGGFPVLYMTDGQAHLRHTSGTVEFLAINGFMPPMIVVAVTNTDRTRDLTPTVATTNGMPPNQASGGGDRFLEFFEKELIPEIESRYRTFPFRVFAGHSFGGTFAINAMTKKPDLFNAIIAVSPALQWDNQVLIQQAKDFFKDADLSKQTLFVSLGGEHGGIEAAYTRFVKLLKKQKGLNYEARHFEDEDHGSVVLRSHYFGLKKIFEGWKPKGAFANLAQIEDHYQKLSQKMGTEIKVPELQVNLLGYRLLQKGKVHESIKAFEWNANHYPESANVYDSLGDGYSAANKLEKALASYHKAMELGEKTDHPFKETFKLNYENAKKKLEENSAATVN